MRSLLTMTLLAPAGAALATFEIKDPAAEIRQRDQLVAAAAAGERSCFDFLVDSVERPEVYRAALGWVNGAVGEDSPAGTSPAGLETALRSYCVDHPKEGLGDAARALAAPHAAD